MISLLPGPSRSGGSPGFAATNGAKRGARYGIVPPPCETMKRTSGHRESVLERMRLLIARTPSRPRCIEGMCDFPQRRIDIGQRQKCECAEPVRVRRDKRAGALVGRPGQFTGGVAIDKA